MEYLSNERWSQNLMIYRPLKDSEIRLLVLKPAKSPAEELVGQLLYYGLHARLDYEALSYTWGDTSLYVAFDMLKKTACCGYAICINQEDIDERQQQVQQMRSIYEQARQVIIWLGEPSEGGGAGVKRLNYFSTWTRFLKPHRNVKNCRSTEEQEYGEISELLDRPWWRRVWIVQEVVLAKQAVLRCGTDEVSWERARKRTQQLNPFEVFSDTDGPPEYSFPDAELTVLEELRSSWRARTFIKTLYELLYENRRFGCTDARDRVYAFLGLAVDSDSIDVPPDYSTATSVVYHKLALTVIQSHQHLLILNLKREYHDDSCVKQQSEVYSIADQAKFHDTEARIIDDAQSKERRSWVRLPQGWERRHQNGVTTFIDHRTGSRHQQSPLAQQAPVPQQSIASQRSLPPGWIKQWDNLGRVKFDYAPNGSYSPLTWLGAMNLPSWVPNWAEWSLWDPQPLVDWPGRSFQRYFASAATSIARESSTHHTGVPSNSLILQGVFFDEIAIVAPAWHPEPSIYEVSPSRKGHQVLEIWEEIALRPVATCPYSVKGVERKNALWRTHITDYVGDQAAPEEDIAYFEVWRDLIGWGPGEIKEGKALSLWEAAKQWSEEGDSWVAAYGHYLDVSGSALRIRDVLKHRRGFQKKYKEYRERIHNVCKNRALFVTENSYIGLAPWNAEVGDSICALCGGETPFLLRKVGDSDAFTLVGESYVYGIMNGEALQANEEMGGALERTFCLL